MIAKLVNSIKNDQIWVQESFFDALVWDSKSKVETITDLTTALSGLSQAEIAKIKSVLDRDQEWRFGYSGPSFCGILKNQGDSSSGNPKIRLDL